MADEAGNTERVDDEEFGRYQADMADHTPHQKKIIRRYYDHREQIMLDKLSECVTELMLADTDAQRKRLWTRAEKAMKTLRVSDSIVGHILASQDPEVLARNLRGWLESGPGSPS